MDTYENVKKLECKLENGRETWVSVDEQTTVDSKDLKKLCSCEPFGGRIDGAEVICNYEDSTLNPTETIKIGGTCDLSCSKEGVEVNIFCHWLL